jgi:hypothetical protein
MREIKLIPLIVELIGSFFASSRDALERSRNAKSSQVVLTEPTGLNIFVHRQADTQASLECIVFSFLAVEACIILADFALILRCTTGNDGARPGTIDP